MEWFLLLAVGVAVVIGVVRGAGEPPAAGSANESSGRKFVRGAKTHSAQSSRVPTPDNSGIGLRVEITGRSETSDLSMSWEQGELQAKRRAFDDVVGAIAVDHNIKKALWREYRKADAGGNVQRTFEILLQGSEWSWPWLEECRRTFQKHNEQLQHYAWRIYQGPPKCPQSAEELTPMLSVVQMRTWLKAHNRYPKPAPRKREEFEALIKDAPWGVLRSFAREVFQEKEALLRDEYARARIDLLVSTLNARAYAERRFEDHKTYGRISTVIPDSTVFAAKESLRFLQEQNRPLPPFYPGDFSRLASMGRDVREEAQERLKDVAIMDGEDPSFFAEKAYKAYWINASYAAANNDYPMTRKWFSKAGMALHGLPGREDEKQRLKDEAAEALRRDPAYIVALADIKDLITKHDDLLQKDIYGLLPYSRDDIGQVLYFAAENGDIGRTKVGRTYKLTLPETD